MKNKVEIKQVVSDLIQLFEISKPTEGNASYVFGNKLAIDKRKFERLQVIDMLTDYFEDKVIIDGYLEVEPITFVHTVFEIKEGHPN